MFFKAYFSSPPSSGEAAWKAVTLVGPSSVPNPAQAGEWCIDVAVLWHHSRVSVRGLETGADRSSGWEHWTSVYQADVEWTCGEGKPPSGDGPPWAGPERETCAPSTVGLAPTPSTLLWPTSLSSSADQGEKRVKVVRHWQNTSLRHGGHPDPRAPSATRSPPPCDRSHGGRPSAASPRDGPGPGQPPSFLLAPAQRYLGRRSAAHSRTEPGRASPRLASPPPPGARTAPPGARTAPPLSPARRRLPATRLPPPSTHPAGTPHSPLPAPHTGMGEHACAEPAASPRRRRVGAASPCWLDAGRFRVTAFCRRLLATTHAQGGAGRGANGRAQEVGRAREDARLSPLLLAAAVGASCARRWPMGRRWRGEGVWPRGGGGGEGRGRAGRQAVSPPSWGGASAGGAGRAVAPGGGDGERAVRVSVAWHRPPPRPGRARGKGRGQAGPLLEWALGCTDRPGCCFGPAGAWRAWRAGERGAFLMEWGGVGWAERSVVLPSSRQWGFPRLEPRPARH